MIGLFESDGRPERYFTDLTGRAWRVTEWNDASSPLQPGVIFQSDLDHLVLRRLPAHWPLSSEDELRRCVTVAHLIETAIVVDA